MSKIAEEGGAMLSLVVHVLASYAVWYGVAHSRLPLWSSIRDRLCLVFPAFYEFLVCPMCCGFWVSLATAFVIPVPVAITDLPLVTPLVTWAVVQGLCGAAALFLIQSLVTRLSENGQSLT